MAGDGTLAKAMWITLKPLALGLFASVVLGVALGTLMGLSRFAEWLGAPIFIIAQSAPLAAQWARSFGGGGNDVSVDQFRRFAAPNIVRFAVPAVAKACVPDPDRRLHELLVVVINDCTVLCDRHSTPAAPLLVEQ